MGTRMCTIQAVPSRTTRLHARAVPWGILILERCPHFSDVTRYIIHRAKFTVHCLYEGCWHLNMMVSTHFLDIRTSPTMLSCLCI